MFSPVRRPTLPFLVFFILGLCSALYGQGMKGKFALSGTGGFGFPVGNFSKTDTSWYQLEDSDLVYHYGFAEISPGFGVNLEYYVTNSLALGLTYFNTDFSFDAKKLEEEFLKDMQRDLPGAAGRLDVDVEGSLFTLGAYGKYLFPLTSRVFPYVKIGAGLSRFERTMDWSWYLEYLEERIDFEGFEEPSFGQMIYLDMGGGGLFRVNQNIGLSVEAAFNHLFAKKREFDVELTSIVNGSSEKGTEKGSLGFNIDSFNLRANVSFFF
jgi:opacity protein-like surface antigen